MNNNPCFNCGYMYADCDEEGNPITLEYCHYEGPADWAPCAQDEYDEEREYMYGYNEPYDYSEF